MAKHCLRLEKDDNYDSVKWGLQKRAVGESEGKPSGQLDCYCANHVGKHLVAYQNTLPCFIWGSGRWGFKVLGTSVLYFYYIIIIIYFFIYFTQHDRTGSKTQSCHVV